jgi:hypothetical protein
MQVFGFLLVMLPALVLAQRNDTVRITPKLPTVKDSITFNLFNSGNCPCSQYYQHAVGIAADKIKLSYEVDVSPCDSGCDTTMIGSGTLFAGGPLAAGMYQIVKMESPYCPAGQICIPVIYEAEVGQLTVIEADTFSIEVTNTNCFVLPCPYYRVMGRAARETTLVVGVKNPDGGYQDPFSRDLVPWRDQGYPVLGYFAVDSLAGWRHPDTVFVIAEVVGWPAAAIGERPAQQTGTSGLAVYPQPVNASAVIAMPRAGMAIRVYAANGRPVEARVRMEGRTAVWDDSGLDNGMYIVSVEDGKGGFAGKVLVKNK